LFRELIVDFHRIFIEGLCNNTNINIVS
jgi:hypothetical protein